MTGRLRVIAAVLVVAFLSVGAQQQPSRPTSIQGVWRVVEQTINDRTLAGEGLGLGFHIYTAGYYAVVRESGTPPRPDVGNVDGATAAQLLAMWGPFVAQFGTYEISGDRLTERTLVAKNPSNMKEAAPTSRRITLEGNTLTTEPDGTTDGRRITLKMVRVE
jgi:hypothetical protein